MTESKPQPYHLCIVLLTGLGDVVHGLPLVNAIRDANPWVRITWIAEPMPAELLANHPSVERIVVYHRRDGLRGVRRLWSDLHALQPVDVTLNLNVYLKSVWPTALSRGRRRIGFDRSRSFEGVWLAANEHLPPRSWAHTADMFLEFASYMNVPPEEPEWRITFTPAERKEQSAFFRKPGEVPVATIVPASASPKKDWIPERWAQVADSLEKEFGFRVVLAGGPGTREQAIAREIVERSSASIEWAMGDSVRRLAWIVAGSGLLIAPDTGPVHIARATGVPVIGIYGHTNPWRVGPWRAYEDLWIDHYTPDAAPPDPSNRKPMWNRMETIEAGEVIEKIRIAVSRYDAARRIFRG
ncbi:MAG: glycosyltransferase family 9 protein [Gemmatimonadales bacterium]